MSKASTIFDAINTKLSTLFSSTKSKIPNPYSLIDNKVIFLRNGYGLKAGQSNPESSEFCNYAYSIGFSILITKEVVRLDDDTDAFDVASKALLEDLKTLQDNMLGYSQLGQGDSIEIINFVGSNGIEFLQGDKNNFIFLEATFSVVIRENF